MESQAIICKVTEPPEWVSSLVVEKNPMANMSLC